VKGKRSKNVKIGIRLGIDALLGAERKTSFMFQTAARRRELSEGGATVLGPIE